MKNITIRVETNSYRHFRIIEEIRFNREIIHEQCICCSELYEHELDTWKLDKAIPKIYDKDIRYCYLSKKYPKWDSTKDIKRKIDDKINLYKYNIELSALKEKYGIK